MYKCFFINLKDLEASFNYEAASIDEALENQQAQIGIFGIIEIAPPHPSREWKDL